MADQIKKKTYGPREDSPEIAKDSNTVQNVAKDILEVPTGILESAKKQLFGEINLVTHQQIENTASKAEQKTVSAEAKVRQLQYMQRAESAELTKNKQSVEKQIAQIMQELQKEVATLQLQTAELTGEAKKISVATTPKNAGVYHLNFFDWVIGELRDIRKRVNESRMWLNLWNRKKKQMGYWNQFKSKGGIGWAMNEERSIATANG